jgi:zinc transport system substrate-binding protein
MTAVSSTTASTTCYTARARQHDDRPASRPAPPGGNPWSRATLRALRLVFVLGFIATAGATGCRPETEDGTPTEAASSTRDAPKQAATSDGASNPEKAPDALKVSVSIPPQKYFVERVGGQAVRVDVLVGAGQSPHSYEPTPKQLAKLAEADVFFRIGVTFEEALVTKIQRSFPELKVVDLREGVELRPMGDVAHHHVGDEDHAADDHADHDHEGHVHGPDCNHGPDELDPHVWLDPKRVVPMVHTIERTLAELRPEEAETWAAGRAAFEHDLEQVDAEIAEQLASHRGESFYVFHPAFGYFGDSYGLEQVSVEVEGKEPGPKQLAELINRARTSDVHLIFVQPQFSQKSAEVLAREIDGAVVPLDPLAEDYLANLRHIAQEVRRAFE